MPACLLRCLLGQGFQDALGFGLGGEDALNGPTGVGAEAHGTVQGGAQIAPRVRRQERKDLAGLGLAAALIPKQALQEADGHFPQLGKTLA